MGLSELDVEILRTIGTALLGVALVVAYFRAQDSVTSSTSPNPPRRLWLAPSPAKRWAEVLFLQYSAAWISVFAVVIGSGVWAVFGPWEYLNLGLLVALPSVLLPAYAERAWGSPEQAAGVPWPRRYWVKAAAWVFVFGFVGNYVWTHYFYALLRATYTLTAHRINFVPVCMFLYTQAYFVTYHTGTTIVLRRWWTSRSYAAAPAWLRPVATSAVVFALAWSTAFMEAFTIQAFPYYHIEDREWMYTVGSIIYAIYFLVSFPMFARMDEPVPGEWDGGRGGSSGGGEGEADAAPAAPAAPKRRGSVGGGKAASSAAAAAATAAGPARAAKAAAKASSSSSSSSTWPLSRALIDSLAAAMLVTLLLDAWRLAYAAARGAAPEGLLPFPPSNVSVPSLPWVQ
jgi:cycloeucalenol cycloisomerase